MNPPPPNDGSPPLPAPSPREELEARLSALVLGEAGEFEAETLRARLKADPDLAALHRRLEAAALAFEHTFEEEHTATALPKLEGSPEHLSPERAARLAQLFAEPSPEPYSAAAAPVGSASKPPEPFDFRLFFRDRRNQMLAVAVGLLLFLTISSLLIPSFSEVRPKSRLQMAENAARFAQTEQNNANTGPMIRENLAPTASANTNARYAYAGSSVSPAANVSSVSNNNNEIAANALPSPALADVNRLNGPSTSNLTGQNNAQDYSTVNVLSAADLVKSVAENPSGTENFASNGQASLATNSLQFGEPAQINAAAASASSAAPMELAVGANANSFPAQAWAPPSMSSAGGVRPALPVGGRGGRGFGGNAAGGSPSARGFAAGGGGAIVTASPTTIPTTPGQGQGQAQFSANSHQLPTSPAAPGIVFSNPSLPGLTPGADVQGSNVGGISGTGALGYDRTSNAANTWASNDPAAAAQWVNSTGNANAAAVLPLGTGPLDLTGGSLEYRTGSNGANNQNYNGNFNFSGTNELNSDTGSLTLGSAPTAVLNNTTNGTLTFNEGGNITNGGVISGVGQLIQANGAPSTFTVTGGSLDLGGSLATVPNDNNSSNWTNYNTFTGGTTLDAGTLVLGNSLALASGNLSHNPGDSNLTFGNLSAVQLGGLPGNQKAALTVGSINEATTDGGNLTGAGNLGRFGTDGLASVAGNANFTPSQIGAGPTPASRLIFDGGALQFSANSPGTDTLSTLPAKDRLPSGTTTPGTTFGILTPTLGTGPVNETDTFDTNGNKLSLSNLESRTGGLAGTNANTLTLGGAIAGRSDSSRTYSGVLAGAGGTISGNGDLAKNGGGTMTLTGTQIYTGGTLSPGNSASSNGNLISQSGPVSIFGDSTGNFTVGGSVSVIKSGAGGLILSGNNGYTGATSITSGTLLLDTLQSAAPANRTITGLNTGSGTFYASAGNLTLIQNTGGGVALNSLGQQVDNSEKFTGGTVVSGGSIVFQTGAGEPLTNFTGAAGLSTTDAGSLVLSNVNNYSGTTSVSGGAVRLDFSPPGSSPNQILSSPSINSLGGGSTLVFQDGNGAMVAEGGGNVALGGLSGTNNNTGYAWASQPVGRAGSVASNASAVVAVNANLTSALPPPPLPAPAAAVSAPVPATAPALTLNLGTITRSAGGSLVSDANSVQLRDKNLSAIAATTASTTDTPVSRPPSEVKFPPAINTADNAFSTFALNVSDAAYQLARAALLNRRWPDPSSTRTEEFLNAFNYHDPAPGDGVAAGFNYDLGQNPIESAGNLLRVSFSTAAAGRDRATPLRLTILLDGSGSMTRADRVATLQAAVRSLGSLLRPGDTVSLVTFARTPQVRAQNIPAERFSEIVNIIDTLQPDGGTNMEEALKTAYAIAVASFDAKAQNRVILLTDGAANLGELDPQALAGIVEQNRKIGIALDAYGVGWDGYGDTTLEALTRKSDGRYAFLNAPADVNAAFAQKLAGALTPAAQDVKLQIEFNPERVISYRLMGYNNLRLTKEQFRDNTVSAGEIAAAEQGTGLYNLVINPQGRGPIGTARARYRDPGTDVYHELTWTIQYQGLPPAFDHATPALRLAAVAAYFAEYLQESPFAAEASPQRLLDLLRGVPEAFAPDQRPADLAGTLEAAIALGGK